MFNKGFKSPDSWSWSQGFKNQQTDLCKTWATNVASTVLSQSWLKTLKKFFSILAIHESKKIFNDATDLKQQQQNSCLFQRHPLISVHYRSGWGGKQVKEVNLIVLQEGILLRRPAASLQAAPDHGALHFMNTKPHSLQRNFIIADCVWPWTTFHDYLWELE